MGRMRFLDALRGAALVAMVLNHTARFWLDGTMGWPRYHLIYVTLTIAAPIFLFLVGFCLPIPVARAAAGGQLDWPRVAGRLVRRGVEVTLAGYLLGLLFFPEDGVLSSGVLQTIGQSIILCVPLLLLVRSVAGQVAILVLAVVLYAAFSLTVPALVAWLPAHPLVAQLWFFDFPPWPWTSIVFIGLVCGWWWSAISIRGDAAGQRRFVTLTAALAGLCLAAFLVHDAVAGTQPRLAFTRDFVVNRHWTPRGVTTLWVSGLVGGGLALSYAAVEALGWRLTWLVTLGRTALLLYFLHHFLVLTLVSNGLGMRAMTWPQYGVMNVVLMGVLLGLGRAWLEIKARRHSRPAAPAALSGAGAPPAS